MTHYRVTWEIDIEASTPLEAAKLARQYQIEPDTTGVVFDVWDEKQGHRIDLLEPEESSEL